MNWKDRTWDLAWQAAELYYDNVLLKGRYPGEFNMYKGMDKDDAVYDLAKRYVGKLRGAIPEDTYDENMERRVDALDLGAVEKYMFEFGKEPFAATRDKKYEAVMDKWYNWDNKMTEKQMEEFGFVPARKGDKQAFLKELSEHQTAHDRARVVKEEMDNAGPIDKFGMAMMPTLTNEATRQSLTGDFDDNRAYGAAAIDLGAQALFGLGGNIRNIVASPLKAAAYDAGVEAARQGINYGVGYEADPMAPVSAGLAGAFAPTGGNWIAHYLSKGGSLEAKPIARGFRRGLRGADDPLTAERNELKQLLMNIHEASKKGQGTVVQEGKLIPAADDLGDIEKALLRDKAKNKLMSLGFRSAEEEAGLEARVMDAQNKFAMAQQSLNQVTDTRGVIPEDLRKSMLAYHGKRAEVAQKELEEALSAQKKYNDAHKTFFGNDREGYPYVEDVIGGSPELGKPNSPLADLELPPRESPNILGVQETVRPKTYPTKPTVSVEEVLTKYYDTPIKPDIKTATGYMDVATAREHKPALDALKEQLPEKYANNFAKGRKKYIVAQQLGGLVGASLKQVEPNLKANPFEPQSYADKVKNFKESKWYKSLPEDKKNAIEKVLKGEK